MAGIFITGTDTGVGKTYVTCLLLEMLRRRGRRAVGYKPFLCGSREDALALAASGEPGVELDEINPQWFKSPVSPYVAALLENRPVDVGAACGGLLELAGRFDDVLVEGAGGWEVPLAGGMTMADLAVQMGLPVLVVMNNRLGALNHTLLTVKAIQARGLECLGVIMNQVADERDAASISNRMVLEAFLEVPVLAELMHGESEVEIEI
jgi:dethiobiotin synthetase